MRSQTDVLRQMLEEAVAGTKTNVEESTAGSELCLAAARHSRSTNADPTQALILALNTRIELVLAQQTQILAELAKRSLVH